MNIKPIPYIGMGLQSYFETNGNAIEIIKLKDIYENLEQSLDRCQDVADIIEDITLKYG